MASTIQDVADKAHVSVSTVSRAFTRPDLVSEKTRRKVLAIAEELNFAVSRSATVFQSGRSFRIALLLSAPVTLWFNAQLYDGLNSVFHDEGYDISIYPIGQASERAAFFSSMPVRRYADAVIVPSFDIDTTDVEKMRTVGIPLAGVNTSSPEGFDVWESTDDYLGVNMAIQHLVSLGHRRIVYVSRRSTTTLSYSANSRRQAFADICRNSPVPLHTTIIDVIDGDLHLNGAFAELIAQSPRPTAICCQEDGIAIALMCKLQRFGVHIPQDVSIIGFDDNDYAYDMGLTTIRQIPRDLGVQTARKTLSFINGEPVNEPYAKHKPQFVCRSSTAPPFDSMQHNPRWDGASIG